MAKLIFILLCLLIALPTFGQDTFQVTTERVDGKATNWQDITADITYMLNQDSTKQIFVDTPDPVALDKDDLQEWFVDAEDGFYKVSFSFTGVGYTVSKKPVQYWFRYSTDGVIFSEPSAVVVMKPGKPVKG